MEKESNSITVGDLKAILRLIDVVSQRGAIKPIEMTGVGELYEKIAKFVTLTEQKEVQNTNQDKSHEK